MGFSASIFALTLALIIGYRFIRGAKGSTRVFFDQTVSPPKTGQPATLMFDIGAVKKSPMPSLGKQDGMQAMRPFMAVAISLVLLGVSLFIILSGNFDAEGQKWAYGTIGTLIGFWLK